MSWKRVLVTAIAIFTLVLVTERFARTNRWASPIAVAAPPANQSPQASPTPIAESAGTVYHGHYGGNFCRTCSSNYPLSYLPRVACILDDRCYFYSPDYGWSYVVKRPIESRNITYQKYWPHRWFGQPRSRDDKTAVPRYPIIATPTDTAQLGYYYQQVPQWQPRPSMLPKPPVPSQWHVRCATSVSYGRETTPPCPLCQQRTQPAPNQVPPQPEQPSASHGPSASNEMAPPPPPDFPPETRRNTAFGWHNKQR